MNDRADFKKMLLPVLKTGAIAAAAVLVILLVGWATSPLVASRTIAEQTVQLKLLAADGEPGKSRIAFPLEMVKNEFDSVILSHCSDDGERNLVSACYAPDQNSRMSLLPGLSDARQADLSRILVKISFVSRGAVLKYFPVKKGTDLAGYILELSGSGFGGKLDLIASYQTDGTLNRALLVKHAERFPGGTGTDRLLDLFYGKKAAGMPVTTAMLENSGADAVSGATESLRGIGLALKAGSLYAARIGSDGR
jgi:Na+-translocating ferredoxin:NAD+ oxidoreductase RnfG subunit